MIIRTPNRDRYVIISKVPLEDSRLSWKARGLHAYLMSKPDNWEVVIEHLITQGPDGRDAVRAGLRELEEAGYIQRSRTRGASGSYDSMTTEVYEEPTTDGLSATTDGLSGAGFPGAGKSNTNEYINIKNNDNNERVEKPKKNQFSEEFKAIWKIYPRHVNKAGAFRAYSASVNRGCSQDEMLLACKNYAEEKRGQEQKFIMHPATFFGPDERWRDFLPSTSEESTHSLEGDEYKSAIIYDDYDDFSCWTNGNGEMLLDNPAKHGYSRPVDGKGRLVDQFGKPYEINTADGKRRYII